MNTLKAEFRKLLTVRSTYGIAAFMALFCVGLMAFWIFGFKDVEHAGVNPWVLRSCLFAVVSMAALLASFFAVLLVCHEYRFNTILYSLTSVNRRTKLFIAKWVAASVMALVLSAVIVGISMAALHIGWSLNGVTAVAQQMYWVDFAWRALATILSSVTLAFIIAMLVRSHIVAIATILMLPSTVEPLLGLLLKENTKYLPYTALGNLTSLQTPSVAVFSLWVVGGYIVVLGGLAYVLFLRRDAN